MNTLAKALVVGVTLLACLTLGAVSTQFQNIENYKNRIAAAEKDAADANASNANLESLLASAKKDIASAQAEITKHKTEKDAAVQSLGQEIEAKKDENTKLTLEKAQLKTELGKITVTLEAQTRISENAIKDNKDLNETKNKQEKINAELRLALQEEQAKTEQLVRLNRSQKEKLIQVEQTLRERETQTVSTTDAGVVLDKAVKGKVTKVDVVGSDIYVELNVGKADGLKKGAELTIYNGNTFRATVKVAHLEARASVGEVLVRSKNTTIKPGDSVMSQPLK